MNLRNLTRRQRKQAVRELVGGLDLEPLLDWVREDGRVVGTLCALLFEVDDRLRWRTVQALGRVAAVLADTDLEPVRDLIRRFLWSMNDESGMLGWHAPEAIGEILVNVPALIDEYGAILGSFLQEEPFERGTHWAVARVAGLRPDVYTDRVDELTTSLRAADPCIRGYTVLTLAALGVGPGACDTASLLADDATVTLYDHETGELRETTVGYLVRSVSRSTA